MAEKRSTGEPQPKTGDKRVTAADTGGQTIVTFVQKQGSQPAPLEEEIDYYLQKLPQWGDHKGEHALIRGRELHGFYPNRDAALAEGLRLFGRVPFLVKQVIPDEQPRPLTGVIL
jgi:hypothetical protein